ncbi:MAG: Hsp20/alpha crystallin family protein [Gammaproteobacteria bacterium]|nr:Hsp20/alpha crystallin family protein [Gammaproteobacteria bacterium]
MTRTHETTQSAVKPLHPSTEEASKTKQHRWLNPFEEMSHLMEGFSARNWMRPLHFSWPEWSHIPAPFGGKQPNMEVIERDKEILLRAELPGVEKKDLDVTMTDHTITIKGTTNYEEKVENGGYYRSEIAHGTFSRTMMLPTDVDLDNVKSSFKNGLLEIHVPKQARASRKISIN